MPHIDIERLALNYSYHIVLCLLFGITASLRIYLSRSNLNIINKLKMNLINSFRYKLRIKN